MKITYYSADCEITGKRLALMDDRFYRIEQATARRVGSQYDIWMKLTEAYSSIGQVDCAELVVLPADIRILPSAW